MASQFVVTSYQGIALDQQGGLGGALDPRPDLLFPELHLLFYFFNENPVSGMGYGRPPVVLLSPLGSCGLPVQ